MTLRMPPIIVCIVITCYVIGSSSDAFAQQTKNLEAKWRGELLTLAPALKTGHQAAEQIYVEGLIRIGLQFSNAGELDEAIGVLSELNDLDTPSALPWGINKLFLETAIAQQYVAINEYEKALQFIAEGSSGEHRHLWHEILLEAVRSDNPKGLLAIKKSFAKVPESEEFDENTRTRILASVELEQLIQEIDSKSPDVETIGKKFLSLLDNPPPAKPLLSPFSGSSFPLARGRDFIVLTMIENGMSNYAMQHIRNSASEHGPPTHPLEYAEALVDAGEAELAREFAGMQKEGYWKSIAYLLLAERQVANGNRMDTQLDLELGLEQMAVQKPVVTFSQLTTIAGINSALEETAQAQQYLDKAFKMADAKQDNQLLRAVIHYQMRHGQEPVWEKLADRPVNTSSISTMIDCAAWFAERQRPDTALEICEVVDRWSKQIGAGAVIGSDGMKVMRSDIWAQVMNARAKAAAQDFAGSLQLMESIQRPDCFEGIRMVGRMRANEHDELIDEWIQSIESHDLRLFAMLGVLEARADN